MEYTLCILGCGTMGIAILSGVIESYRTSRDANEPAPSRFIACVSPKPEEKSKVEAIFASSPIPVDVWAGKNVQGVREADIVILCCKPQLAETILSESGMRDALRGKLLLSILAGVTQAQLKTMVFPETTVLRVMPNTPCKIREGMTVISNSPVLEPANAKIVEQIFSSLGRCTFLDEKHFDACTALSGSGPAFACIFLEAMADGGVMMGLPRDQALELAAQTLQGAARMVLQSGMHPAQLKDNVTTPGGCTIAGLLALEDGRVRSTIARGIQVATERASELGQPKKK
ncbi:pyrroline-5-carboxylate reductase [Fistulina hepatica ATCC 64428]|uniref:Pyrroline-5-carboxylate reductase n=1 Tax=Fistulina hepatica ATCC 64428 TaxID=1128425 RepID=A0A0D7ABL2_9AGAR|nr:pyrroline-5-carboxylate reductase [Fistulina hepatica ATCC 64428]